MKVKFCLLVLVIVTLILSIAPPTFARINDPMFGLSWRPDMCFAPYDWICADGYNETAWESNRAIDWATNFSGCGDSTCLFESYTQYMVSSQADIYAFSLLGSTSEGIDWVMQLIELFIQEQAIIYGVPYGGCTLC